MKSALTKVSMPSARKIGSAYVVLPAPLGPANTTTRGAGFFMRLFRPAVLQPRDLVEHRLCCRVIVAICHEVAMPLELKLVVGRSGLQRRLDIGRDDLLAVRIQAGLEVLAAGVRLLVAGEAGV